MQICPSCGIERVRDGEFCASCSRQARPGSDGPVVNRSGISSRTWRRVGGVLAVVAFACGVAAVWFTLKWRNGEESTARLEAAETTTVTFAATVVDAPVTEPPITRAPDTTVPADSERTDDTVGDTTPESTDPPATDPPPVTPAPTVPPTTVACSFPAAANEVALNACGPAVQLIQQALVNCGFMTPIDGLFADATDQALRAFQTSRGLSSDGKAGPKTQVALGQC